MYHLQDCKHCSSRPHLNIHALSPYRILFCAKLPALRPNSHRPMLLNVHLQPSYSAKRTSALNQLNIAETALMTHCTQPEDPGKPERRRIRLEQRLAQTLWLLSSAFCVRSFSFDSWKFEELMLFQAFWNNMSSSSLRTTEDHTRPSRLLQYNIYLRQLHQLHSYRQDNLKHQRGHAWLGIRIMV
ncbi:hypothetical protein OE88DRAFT_1145101 [Heliocybe sulcata]|uniref:Uncharacterized protein n=1 Tax=Heliocybe sulcata TaxID=5364 RepID=A0A5C3N9W2_9AGAM|nr:hypothetical protein OE88DRAFT_1145101 [Heliocybe sulcata]